ncbi:MAG TPA: hypothetical protein VHR38_07775 [Solirubrobacterales bacterium]|nr:hypothetical protein [Solirubrobacterales bacterium]
MALLALVFGSTLAAGSAEADFGLKEFDVYFSAAPDGTPAAEAGSHPYGMVTTLAVNSEPDPTYGEVPEDEVKDMEVQLPVGFAGNPGAAPRCATEDFISTLPGDPQTAQSSLCPDATAIGEVAAGVERQGRFFHAPVYNLVPSPGTAAKFGFVVLGVPVTIDATVNPDKPHNIIAKLTNISQTLRFYKAKMTLWGDPSDPVHDPYRGSCVAVYEQDESTETPSRGVCPVKIPETAFLTLPRSCNGPLTTNIRLRSWQNPGTWVSGPPAISHDNLVPPLPLPMTGCDKLGFAPTISSAPTTRSAESPSGLDFNLDVNDKGLTTPTSVAQSDIQKAVVTLPKGVTVNPSVAEGLAACAPGAYASEAINVRGCPEASKIGNVEVETPLLAGELLRGSLFVATPDDPSTPQPGAENPFDSLIALYMVIKDPELGIMVKLAGKVEPDPITGQLVTTFDDIPQFPFSHFRFHFRSGGRSPLVTPPTCGNYQVVAQFTPRARPSEPLTTSAPFTISSGVGGGACPAGGVPPFRPGFEAGSINNNAGSYSPFYMRLTRADGEQDMTRFSAVLPPGVTGKLAGIARCPEAAIEAAKAKTGRAEQAFPSCPADSQIGTTIAGAGVGPELTYVPGKLYLGGPVGNAQISVIAITPAVAGPFDAGTVVVREALKIDPDTAEVVVDGASSDPIPHILKGIPLKLRDLRVHVDRDKFTLNPTNCDPSQTTATLFGSSADVFSAVDDFPVALVARYQAASCSTLKFKPKLSVSLKGNTKRSANTSLQAVLSARSGDANLAGAVVTLPPSQFIDNAHINNPCTRVQFNANACPANSILGRARAFTPLLDKPLEGPVYFRSNGGARNLPDVVADLGGELDFTLVIAILTSDNGRIRSKVLNAPDAPVSKFVLRLAGGKKGLLENSEELCSRTQRAGLKLIGQNGRLYKTNPVIGTSCKGKPKKTAQRHRHAR